MPHPLRLRRGASERARTKIGLTALLTGTPVKEASGTGFGTPPFEPEDGCVVMFDEVVLCGANSACRLMSLASQTLDADDASVDDWIEWSETALAPAVARLISASLRPRLSRDARRRRASQVWRRSCPGNIAAEFDTRGR